MKLLRPTRQSRCGRLSVFLALALASSVSGRAETWLLRNGDQVTGELLASTPDSIVIQDATLGRLTIPRQALAPTKATVEKPKPVASAPKPKWTRQIEFGFSGVSGAATQQDLSARVQIDRTGGPDTLRATGTWTESEAAGTTVADGRDADFRWRHDLTPRVFLQTLATYQRDVLRDLDFSLEQQAGAGLRLLDRGGHQVNVGLGVAWQREDRDLAGNETALLGTFFQDYSHAWGERLKFTQDSSFAVAGTQTLGAAPSPVGSSPVPVDGGNYRMKFDAAVLSKVTAQATLSLRYEYDYDHSLPVPDLRGAQRLTTSLGYAW